MIKFELNYKQNKIIENALKKTNENLEQKLNSYLHLKGSSYVEQAILNFIPRSNKNKKHAKDRKSLKIKDFNLGFEVASKPSYRYLVFPDHGIGPHNRVAQQFFEKGLESKEDKLFNDILKIIDETL